MPTPHVPADSLRTLHVHNDNLAVPHATRPIPDEQLIAVVELTTAVLLVAAPVGTSPELIHAEQLIADAGLITGRRAGTSMQRAPLARLPTYAYIGLRAHRCPPSCAKDDACIAMDWNEKTMATRQNHGPTLSFATANLASDHHRFGGNAAGPSLSPIPPSRPNETDPTLFPPPPGAAEALTPPRS